MGGAGFRVRRHRLGSLQSVSGGRLRRRSPPCDASDAGLDATAIQHDARALASEVTVAAGNSKSSFSEIRLERSKPVPSTGKRNGELGTAVYWDLAATEKTDFNDPDWTVAIKLGRDRNGRYWLLDMVRARSNPGDVERLLRNTAEQDGKRVRIGFGQDPGQAGKSQALHLVRALSAYTARGAPEAGASLRASNPWER